MQKKLQYYLTEKPVLTILFALWATTQIIAYFHFGIMLSVDSELYINNATAINLGNWPQGREIFYLSYSLLIAVLQLMGLEATWIVMLQVFVAAMALFSVYKITWYITKSNQAPFVAALLYILWFKFQQWNLIVYTDSLFANSAVITIYLLLLVKSKWMYVLTTCMIAFLVFLRPIGILFLMAVLSYMLYDKISNNKGNLFLRIGVWAVFTSFCLVVVNETLRNFVSSFLQSYAHAEIIYPNITVIIDKPEQLIIPNNQHQPLIQLLLFMVNNPVYMIKISILKAVLFLAHIKPYYSLLHNLVIVLFLYPTYFFALKGAKLMPKSKLYVFMIIFMALQVLSISLTSENWDGRFLLPLLPWIFIMASVGLIRVRLYT